MSKGLGGSVVSFGTKNMVGVNLMAMALFWHGFDNY